MKERYTAIFDDDDDGERTKKKGFEYTDKREKKSPKQNLAAT